MYRKTPLRVGLWTLALVAAASFCSRAAAQPANDDCTFSCGAFANTVDYGNNPFSTVGATNSVPTESGCGFINGGHFYNDTWYFFRARCAGPMTISLCGSTFDTELGVYTTCPFHLFDNGMGGLFCIYDNNQAIACNDDSCGLSSQVTFTATAGNFYTIRIGAYSPGVTGTGNMVISGPTCEPSAIITGPAALSCQCLPVAILGTAHAPGGAMDHWVLEARPLGLGAWSTIHTDTSDITSGLLYSWNDLSLTEGYYEVRLTVVDVFGQDAQDFDVFYINRVYDSVDLRKPVVYNAILGTGIYGGRMCFDGTVYDGGCSLNYSVDYAPTPVGTFNPVDPGSPNYPGAVLNDPLGTTAGDLWNTRTGPTAVPDGIWYIRVTGRNACSQIATVTRQVLIDNTAPVATLSAPLQCTVAHGNVQIRGTVFDANLSGWTLQYTGGTSHGWTTLTSGTANMPPNSLLFTWNTAGLQACAYTIRLIASDKAVVDCFGSNSTEYEVSLDLGCPGDFNRDNVVNSADFFDFLNAFFTLCP